MKLPASLQLIASLALLAALVIPAAAQAGGSDGSASAGHSNRQATGKKHHKKKGVGDDIDCSPSAKECHVDIVIHEASPLSGGGGCGSYDNSEGFCVGPTSGTVGWSQPSFFPRQGISSSFTWKSRGGRPRDVEYHADADALTVEAYILGESIASNSNVLNVSDAWNRDSHAHWKTVDLGAKVGYPGGPMGLDYDRKTVGSSVHLWGFFVRK